jgi:UDP-glucose 4-epimerase
LGDPPNSDGVKAIMAIVWITGTHGFIGRHLASYLSRQGHSVFGIGHGVWPEYDSLQWGVTRWVNAEINASNLESLCSLSGEPEWLFHLAGGSTVGGSFANPLEDFSRTVSTTAHLMDWLRTHVPTCRVIAISSAAVYGSGYGAGISESAITAPYSPYGHHKLMMEQLCHAYAANFGLKTVIVRLFSVYGPWLRKQLLWDLCSKIATGVETIRLGGTGEECRDWTDVRDVVRLLELVASIASDQVPLLNGGGGIPTTVRQVADLVALAWKADVKLEFSGQMRPGDPFSLVSDNQRLVELGFCWEVDISTGIRTYVDWFKKFMG